MIEPSIPIASPDIAGHYDELDFYYRKLWGEHIHHGLWLTGKETPHQAVRQLMSRIADDLQVCSGDRVCDVGCGYGGTSRYLAQEHDAELTGLTISQAQFEFAVEQSRDVDAKFLLSDWQQNELPPQSFDRLVSIECLAHVEDKRLYFEEIRRVLKPGGRAVVTAWLAGESPSERECQNLLEPICREGRLPGMGSQSEYSALIRDAGLRLSRFDDLSRQVMKTWEICKRRIVTTLLTSPAAWWFVLNGKVSHAVFLRTVWRIEQAYHCGAMRYGLFVVDSDES